MILIMISQVSTDIYTASNLIRMGHIVAFPTETVYGLGVCLSQKDAVEKIYRLKNRAINKPLALHVHEVAGLEDWVDNPIFFQLAEAFLPGPLSIIVKSKKKIPQWVNSVDQTIGIRVTADPLAQEFLREVKEPVVATSANHSGYAPALSAQAVREMFPVGLGAILDGTPKYCLESTVVKIEGNQVVILRKGAISQAEIEKVCFCHV